MKKIYIAAGCFWGVEAYYQRLKGVEQTSVGYAQGNTENPSYEAVCKGDTGFVEACLVEYNEEVITLEHILEHMLRISDPTSLNKQGNDIGTQYRSGVYTVDEQDEASVKQYFENMQSNYLYPIVTEVAVITTFYDAETYHQKYLDKNVNGYCHVNMGLIKTNELKDIYK